MGCSNFYLPKLNWTWNPLNLVTIHSEMCCEFPRPVSFLWNYRSSSNLLLSLFSSDDFPNQISFDAGKGFNGIWLSLISMYPFIHLFSKYTECLPCRGSKLALVKQWKKTQTFISQPFQTSRSIERIPFQCNIIITF